MLNFWDFADKHPSEALFMVFWTCAAAIASVAALGFFLCVTADSIHHRNKVVSLATKTPKEGQQS